MRMEKLMQRFVTSRMISGCKISFKKLTKVVDNVKCFAYNNTCVTGVAEKNMPSGCGSVWLERLVWDQEAAGSNPVTPIGKIKYAGVVQW